MKPDAPSVLPHGSHAATLQDHDPLVLYRALVDQVPDALIFANRDGVIRIWNRGAEALFGFHADEAIGKRLDLIIPERFREAHWRAFDQAVANGRTRHGNRVRTTRAQHKLGHKLYVDLSFGLVTDSTGTVLGAVAMGRDGTARYEADKARENAVAAEAMTVKPVAAAAKADQAINLKDEQAP